MNQPLQRNENSTARCKTKFSITQCVGFRENRFLNRRETEKIKLSVLGGFRARISKSFLRRLKEPLQRHQKSTARCAVKFSIASYLVYRDNRFLKRRETEKIQNSVRVGLRSLIWKSLLWRLKEPLSRHENSTARYRIKFSITPYLVYPANRVLNRRQAEKIEVSVWGRLRISISKSYLWRIKELLQRHEKSMVAYRIIFSITLHVVYRVNYFLKRRETEKVHDTVRAGLRSRIRK